MSTTYNNIKGQEINLVHYKGDLFDEVWSIAKSDGTPYDLSGKTLVLSIKKRKTDATAEQTITTTAGEITISGDDNEVITFNKVVAMDPRTYFYDLEIVEDFYTPAYGTWEETGDVNR